MVDDFDAPVVEASMVGLTMARLPTFDEETLKAITGILAGTGLTDHEIDVLLV
jgi:hypothetical protein